KARLQILDHQGPLDLLPFRILRGSALDSFNTAETVAHPTHERRKCRLRNRPDECFGGEVPY
ncbi:MAG TPA: hypothetical protein VJM81_02855, partial [Rhizorhapis sp.]|nr:hypothetical protein [Rhizorhapis sp.]